MILGISIISLLIYVFLRSSKRTLLMNSTILIGFLLTILIRPLFGQHIDILNNGSFKGELNDKRFINGIRFGNSDNFFTIETSNDDFILRINWRDVNSADDLRKQFIKLPAADNSVIINFVDKKTNFPYVVTGGRLHIFRKDILGVSGTIEFTALSRFTENGRNYKINLENGNFRIDLTE